MKWPFLLELASEEDDANNYNPLILERSDSFKLSPQDILVTFCETFILYAE